MGQELSHPAVNWSQTCDLAPLRCPAAATSLSKALQPGPSLWGRTECASTSLAEPKTGSGHSALVPHF